MTANLLGKEAVAALAADEAARAGAPQGWRGALPVTVVADRREGSKRLPPDVAAALRSDARTRCVILDDNPTAWETSAKSYVWVAPQFDVFRPLSQRPGPAIAFEASFRGGFGCISEAISGFVFVSPRGRI